MTSAESKGWLWGGCAVLAGAVAYFLVPLLWTWGNMFVDPMPVHEEVLVRRTSPNGRLEAVLITRDAGATTSVGYFLVVGPLGMAPSYSDSVLIFQHVQGMSSEVTLDWKDDHNLVVRSPACEVFEDRTPWKGKDGTSVAVRLISGDG